MRIQSLRGTSGQGCGQLWLYWAFSRLLTAVIRSISLLHCVHVAHSLWLTFSLNQTQLLYPLLKQIQLMSVSLYTGDPSYNKQGFFFCIQTLLGASRNVYHMHTLTPTNEVARPQHDLRGSAGSAWHASSAPGRWSPAGGQGTCCEPWCTPGRWRPPGQSSAPWVRCWAEEGWSPPPEGRLCSCLHRVAPIIHSHSCLGLWLSLSDISPETKEMRRG